jgi:CheY-like chemotaxis protein
MPARILIVEDNPANLELMRYLLCAHRHAVLSAINGESGVESARAHRPDLVLCDVHLPDIDGFAVVRQLKQDASVRDIPVVAITAFAMVGDRDRMLEMGFDGYLPKPITPETFVPEVEAYLLPDLRTTAVPRS